MAENITEELEKIFFEETSTRKPLINYTVKYFAELDPVIARIKGSEAEEEAYKLASAQLNRNAQHIAALYIAGVLNFERGDYEDTHLEKLLSIFKNIKKWPVVEFIAQKVLDYTETDYALRYIASYYQVINREDKAVDIWERLIKFDTENYELPERIAHIKEREQDIEAAVKYYEIALSRNIAKHRERVVETNFKKIFELKPDNLKYFLKIEEPLAELLGANVTVDLLKQIFFYYFENSEFEKALTVIKRILSYEDEIKEINIKKAKFFRHRLVDTLKALYPDHSNFEGFAKHSQLINVNQDPEWCCSTFEKHAQYDVKKFVYHRNFGVGRIKQLNENDMIIDFKDSPNHKMTFEMMMKSVSVLDEEDIRVYKTYRLRQLKKLADEEPDKIIEMALKSTVGERLSSKDLKHIVAPDIIPENQYNKWLDKAKKEVRAHNDIKFVKNAFVFKKGAQSYDEETLESFNREKYFENKFQIYNNYSSYATDINNEQSQKMAQYFKGIADSEEVDSDVVNSIMLIQQLRSDMGLKIEMKKTLDDVVKKAEDPTDIYENLPSAKFRERWVSAIIRAYPDSWENIVKDFLYTVQVKNHHIITSRMLQLDKVDLLEHTIEDILLKYNEYTEPFIYFASKLLTGEYNEESKAVGVREIQYNSELLMIGLLNLIPHLNKLMEKKIDLNHNRKMLRTVYELLFDKGCLFDFIDNAERKSVEKLFREFKKLIGLENQYKTMVIARVTKRFEDLS